MSPAAPSPRSRVHRAAERAHYDSATVHAIVDAAWLCHVAFAAPDPVCIPTACWRVGDHLYIHGSPGSRMMAHLGRGAPACVSITHLDGLVLARSAVAHSMNYRSVVIHGAFGVVAGPDKVAALDAFMDHLVPGRRPMLRPHHTRELDATTVLRLPLQEAAAKIRNWGPKDKEADLDAPVWAGVLPLRAQHLPPQAEPGSPVAPEHVRHWAQ